MFYVIFDRNISRTQNNAYSQNKFEKRQDCSYQGEALKVPTTF